jgi:hypothetical protein
LVRFGDESEKVLEWDAIQDRVMYDFTDRPDIEYVKIDPKNIIEFELDKKNNSWVK